MSMPIFSNLYKYDGYEYDSEDNCWINPDTGSILNTDSESDIESDIESDMDPQDEPENEPENEPEDEPENEPENEPTVIDPTFTTPTKRVIDREVPGAPKKRKINWSMYDDEICIGINE